MQCSKVLNNVENDQKKRIFFFLPCPLALDLAKINRRPQNKNLIAGEGGEEVGGEGEKKERTEEHQWGKRMMNETENSFSGN